MQKVIHGFIPNEVVDLYHFLCIYESKIKDIPNQKVLEEKFPKLKKSRKLMSNIICNKCNQKSLNFIGIVPMENLVSMTYSKSSKFLSLLHHLRNSIAHGQLEKEGEFISLIDYEYETRNGIKEKTFSSRGKIESTILLKFIHQIIKNIS